MNWLEQFMNPTEDGGDARFARSMGLGNAVAPHSVYGEHQQEQHFGNTMANMGQLFQMMMLMNQAGQNAARQIVAPGLPQAGGQPGMMQSGSRLPSWFAMLKRRTAPGASPTDESFYNQGYSPLSQFDFMNGMPGMPTPTTRGGY